MTTDYFEPTEFRYCEMQGTRCRNPECLKKNFCNPMLRIDWPEYYPPRKDNVNIVEWVNAMNAALRLATR